AQAPTMTAEPATAPIIVEANKLRIGGVATEINITTDIPTPRFERNRIQAVGNAVLRDLAWSNLAAQQARADFKLSDNRIVIEPIVLEQEKGQTTLRLESSLTQFKQWQLAATVNSWPSCAGGGARATLG